MPPGVRLRPANPWWQRLKRRVRAIRGGALHKTHQVHLADLNGERYKRVRFAHADEAEQLASALRRLRDTSLFPELVHAQDSDLWLRYVEGRPPRPRSAADSRAVVDFFVRLYARTAHRTASVPPELADRLDSDLLFIAEAGVLSHADASALRELGKRLAPARIWMGMDYIDPVPKNFIINSTGAVGIDIEALMEAQPLGQGLAKLLLRWPGPCLPASEVLARCATAGIDLREHFTWTQLVFLAAYTRQKVLQRKPRHIDRAALLRLLDSPVT
jgi:hypothetical protein